MLTTLDQVSGLTPEGIAALRASRSLRKRRYSWEAKKSARGTSAAGIPMAT